MKRLREYLGSEDFQILKSSVGEYFQHFLDTLMNSESEEGLYNAQWGKVPDSFLSRDNTGICIGQFKIPEDISRQHILVTAATGYGKTTSIIQTSLLSAENTGASFLVYDESKDIAKTSSGYLSSIGYQVGILDFEDIINSIRWNPLAHIHSQADISKVAELLLSAIESKSSDPFWLNSAISTLAIFLELTMKLDVQYRNIAYTKELIMRFSYDSGFVDELMSKYADEQLLSRYKYIITISEKTLSGILQSIMASISIFSLENIRKITSDYENSFDLNSIREKATVIYLFNNLENSKVYASLLGLFLVQVTNTLMKKQPKQDTRTVYYLLDETNNLAHAIGKDLSLWSSQMRKYFLSLTMVIQDWQSLRDFFGSSAQNIYSNCYTKVFFAGQDIDTATRLSKTLGETIGIDTNKRGKIVPLYSPQEIMRMPSDQVIVVAGNRNPYKFKVVPFYKQFTLNKRSKIAPVYK